ncbi:branched-chain amino acid transport system II carrier protein [Macrococcoides bohemicum]|uniref:Branched-chain amino acid transport system carrier protein n=1 Tax=Macrococcoides bohemicum TaxID=1903056 RepID=A0AAE7Q319_9STAP|nr:branched-chain amino acid transport system II carrier protein [Macrococcus bohemicus]QRN49892.1 branched-chain amino acid transport system II carrier protein [Macrococcus bohemicus]QYA41359.1 branched-chain amino acid transport system II carrier protein [Macrococcus bohemicus]QYA43783.1 branched-chain amino acid transport system II carrier protein [Macrococcus bohemicus]
MNKNTWVVGFMLFAIFFGAGNLIFPPNLGFASGQFFWPAIFGFILTGVGLPLLGIIVGSLDESGYKGVLHRINPVFGILFLSAVYLTIGPLFAIPRTGATSYEMAVLPFLKAPSAMSLLIFTIVFFGITLWLAINPSKMVDRVGAILTPLLLISIIALVVVSIFLLSDTSPVKAQADVYTNLNTSFFSGFTSGYQTMDAIAAIAFSVIVINAIKEKGISKETGLFKQTILAGIIAAIALGFIYLTLGWIGSHYHLSAAQLSEIKDNESDLGTYILTHVAHDTFGTFGKLLIGIIVSLACLTTSTGLVVAVSEYFNEIFPKISYKTYAIAFTLFSFILANQGLKAVIEKSIPVLLILYPIAMTLVLIMLVAKFVPTPLLAFQIPIILVTIVSVLSVISSQFKVLPFMNALPLKAQSMEWLIFAVVGYIIGYVLGLRQTKIAYK